MRLKRLVLPALLCALLPLPGAAQRFRASPVSTARAVTPWQEAAIAAQGVDSFPFLDSIRVADVQRLLVRIRGQVTAVAATVPEGQYWATELFVDPAWRPTLERNGRELRTGRFLRTWVLRRTGIPWLDSLNALFAADSLVFRIGAGPGDKSNPVLRVVFRYAMNVPAVLAAYGAGAGILAATSSPDDGPQTGQRWRFERALNGWRVELEQGLGECSVACTGWLRWRFQVDAKGGAVEVMSRDTLHRP